MVNKEICLLNDSFPPLIDGVANTVINYARILQQDGVYSSSVVVPEYPGADDTAFDFPVIRYPSIDLRRLIGYTAGNPFEFKTLHELGKRNIALLHSHCPVASNYLARGLREKLDVPLVMTYHTKFDVDIENAIRGKILRQGLIKALVESVSSVDELWVVSKGAGDNIRSLGYAGDYVVMPNGVDMPRGRATDAEIHEAVKDYDLPNGVPVFLFVGRLMWYKGLKIILDALAALRSQGIDFRMVFVGKGGDEKEVRDYVTQNRLNAQCFFTGPIYDRRILCGWYSRADLFLFPSTYDTNGLVVREAAASSLPTVMVAGSCAAEDVTNGVNGLFIEENAASLAVCLSRVVEHPSYLKKLGEHAAADLYLSWEDSVHNAMERYGIVCENYRAGLRNHRRDLTDEMMSFQSELLESYERFDTVRTKLEDRIERYL